MLKHGYFLVRPEGLELLKFKVRGSSSVEIPQFLSFNVLNPCLVFYNIESNKK